MSVRIGQKLLYNNPVCLRWHLSSIRVARIRSHVLDASPPRHIFTSNKLEYAWPRGPTRPTRSILSTEVAPNTPLARSSYSTRRPDSDEPSTSDATLPSHAANQRWQVSQRLQTTMDHVLSKAASASRRLNIYTGTDYTGIEALRRAIIDQGMHISTR